MSSNILEQRSFNGGCNADDKYTSVLDNEYINAQNFRYGNATEAGKAKNMQSVPGTTLLFNGLPAGTNVNMGCCPDNTRQRVLFFNKNSNGNHGIYCYDSPTLTTFIVILDSQITGGLNFSDLDYIHSCFIINDRLYWCNANNTEPKRINIEKGIKLNQPSYVTTQPPYVAPLDPSVISWIRRQPGLPPSQVKSTQTVPALVNNFIKLDAFQFCYRYIYGGYEEGTLSGLSTLADFNQDSDTYNRIDVTIPLQEFIQQDVIQIDLVAKYLISGVYFIIKSWVKAVPADSAAIAAHNAGTTALTYAFYNDRIGSALDSAYSVKPFDSVPNYAQTCAVAKDRTFMANYTIGYDTVKTTSLTAVPNLDQASAQIIGKWVFLRFQSQSGGTTTQTSIYLLDITGIPNANNPGYYQYIPGGVPPYPASVSYTNCQFLGGGFFEVMNHLSPGTVNTILQTTQTGQTSIVTNGPAPAQFVGKQTWKSDSIVQVSINFRDYYGRASGVYFTDASKVAIPERTYGQTDYYTSIQWALDNTNAINEIPSWAYYYSINITKCLRTRLFSQIRPTAITYATKDSNNIYTFTDTYASTNAGVAIDVTSLLTYNMGYTFNSGDVVKIYFNNNNPPISLAISGTSGKFIICEMYNFGTLNIGTPAKIFIEIYTPYKQQPNEPNFECGQIFQVANPGTASRSYSLTTGRIYGDVWLLNRNDGTIDYLAECMSPTDKLWTLWETNSGRPNFIDTIGKVTRTNSVCFSNTIVIGTKINGLSTYDALDIVEIPSENGPISKLQLASKIERLGSIMLAICANESVSMYLAETVVAAPQGTAFLATSGQVVGTIYPLKGSFGTQHPESVAEYRGDVYWFDGFNGVVIQYSSNGLSRISDFNMKHFWRKWAINYEKLTPAQIEAFGSRPFVQGGIDPFNLEYLLSIPQIEATNPNGTLPGFASNPPQNLFDIYDGQAKTMVFNFELNKWMPTVSYCAEGFQNVSNQLYGFKNGLPYRHNDVNARYNNFYGVDYVARVMFPSSQDSTDVKIYNSVSIESDIEPTYGVMYCTYPNEQCTDWDASTTQNKEGAFVASIYRDRNSPKYVPDYDAAWLSGDKMRSRSAVIELDFNYNQAFTLRYVNINYIKSTGHRVKPQQRQEHQG